MAGVSRVEERRQERLCLADRLRVAPGGDELQNLVNDLNLEAACNGVMPPSFFIGNTYYVDPCESSRQGCSLNRPSTLAPDSRNNVERIDISPAQLSQNNISTLTVKVSPGVIRGDGIEPTGSTLRQDFALFVVNAHE